MKLKAMKKAYNAICEAYETGNLKKHGFKTPLDLYEARYIFIGLRDQGTANTLAANEADFFKSCGFTVKPAGIGWMIK